MHECMNTYMYSCIPTYIFFPVGSGTGTGTGKGMYREKVLACLLAVRSLRLVSLNQTGTNTNDGLNIE
jgi:hypothetical protein